MGSEFEEMISQIPATESASPVIKTCADCGTTTTPRWRGGTAGPKSLCNACGIKSIRRRRAHLGMNKEEKKSKNPTTTRSTKDNSVCSSSNSGCNIEGTNEVSPRTPLKRKFLSIGREVALQTPRSQQQRRKLGEVEKAAIILMALSSGSVFA